MAKTSKADKNGPRNDTLCYTGLSHQPPGYSPGEVFAVTIDPLGPCRQSSPGSVLPRRIGNGFVRCGSSAPTLFFRGSSNAKSSTALFRMNQQFACPASVDEQGNSKVKTYTAWGEIKFNMLCEHDAQFNATCKSEPERFQIPVVGWRAGYSSRLIDGFGYLASIEDVQL